MSDSYNPKPDPERPFEAWSSHRYMTVNTCFGQFATREEAQACIDARLRETRDIDVWVYPWIKNRPASPDGGPDHG